MLEPFTQHALSKLGSVCRGLPLTLFHPRVRLASGPLLRRERSLRQWTISLSVLLGVAGCAVGPDYKAPAPPVPSTWTGAAENDRVSQTQPQALSAWWAVLRDPILSNLIGEALARSPDIRTAQARFREARARRALAGAELFPTVTASASGRRTKASEESGSGATFNRFSAGFDASWEPDVFGGTRRGIEAAQADLEAAQESLYGSQVTLAAEVALNYVELRTFQGRLQIARDNLATQSETYDITRWRAEAGLTTALDVEQSRADLERTRALLPTLETGRSEAQHRLEILLGRQPGELQDVLTAPATLPSASVRLAVGIPADTLRQRPDVRAAERRLAAETARIGVATAAAYPSFPLSGSIGVEALTLGALGNASALTASIAAGVTAPIFDAGRIRSRIEIQNALQEQALIGYEASVLTALQEVEDALVALRNTRDRRASLELAEEAASNAALLARYRYETGVADFQAVLDTQRTLLSVQDSLTSSKAENTSAVIQLYKALGGGWTATPASTRAPAAAGKS